MTRQEHLNWCKQRALEYVAAGDNSQAFASMCSDVMKHEETKMHRSTNQLGMSLMMAGHLDSPQQMRGMDQWIQLSYPNEQRPDTMTTNPTVIILAFAAYPVIALIGTIRLIWILLTN